MPLSPKAGLVGQGVVLVRHGGCFPTLCCSPQLLSRRVAQEHHVAAEGKPETLLQTKEKILFYFPKLLTGLSLFNV